MKKYVLLITVFLTVLISLNGCIVVFNDENDTKEDVKEVFAPEEDDSGDEQSSDSVEALGDESREPSEQMPPYEGNPHNFVNKTGEGEILSPDGTVLATYDYSYPVFECNEGDDKEYVEAINKMFRDNAMELVSSTESERQALIEQYEYLAQNNWSWFGPYDYRYGYEIHLDAKGILSVTQTRYSYTGGAHGNARKESHTFDVVAGRELSLSDLLYGTDAEITQAFTNEFLKIKDEFFDDPSKIVPQEFPTVEYYVDTDGVTAYFQQYQVGSYASGFVSATVSDKEMLKYDFSNIQEN